MKNKNFDSISKFSVPQSWIDGAKNAKNSDIKKKAVIFIGIRRYVAAVACLLTVIGLTMLVYFLNDSKIESRPVNNSVNLSHSQSVTDSKNDNSSNGTSPSSDKKKPTMPFVIETTPDGDIIIIETTPSHTDAPQSSETPTQIHTDPTEQPSSQEPPTEEPSTSRPSEPSDPSVPIPPSEDISTELPTHPVEPSMPEVAERVVATVNISKKALDLIGNVYCKVYDDKGNMYGDADLYSQQHAVTPIPRTDGKVTLYYEIERALLGTGKSYRFVYYDSNGVQIAQTTKYYVTYN